MTHWHPALTRHDLGQKREHCSLDQLPETTLLSSTPPSKIASVALPHCPMRTRTPMSFGCQSTRNCRRIQTRRKREVSDRLSSSRSLNSSVPWPHAKPQPGDAGPAASPLSSSTFRSALLCHFQNDSSFILAQSRPRPLIQNGFPNTWV